jgi:hypothetical protein
VLALIAACGLSLLLRPSASRIWPAPYSVRAGLGVAAPHVDERTAVVLDGISYTVLAATRTPTVRLSSGEMLRAGGTFEVVKIRASNLTPQTRSIGPARLNLAAGKALHAPSSAATALLSGSRWRPLESETLRARHSAVRKLFYDLPPRALAQGAALRIGVVDATAPFGVVRLGHLGSR